MTSWWRLSLPHAVFCVTESDGVVTEAAPIGRWMVGRALVEVRRWAERKGGSASRIAGPPGRPHEWTSCRPPMNEFMDLVELTYEIWTCRRCGKRVETNRVSRPEAGDCDEESVRSVMES